MKTLKKFILGSLLALGLLLAPNAAHAQSRPVALTMGTTVTADTDAGQTYFSLLVSGGNVTTFQFTSVAPQNAEVVLVAFQQDGTGSRTVGLAANINGTLTFNATANHVTLARFTYDVVAQAWFVETVGHN